MINAIDIIILVPSPFSRAVAMHLVTGLLQIVTIQPIVILSEVRRRRT